MILEKSFLFVNWLLKKHVLLSSMLKIVVLLDIFCGNHDTFFSGCKEEQHFFCKIINVFNVTSDQINAFLLIKIIFFLKKKKKKF